jgi:isocitrate/isopropylmalate dehydrogenase
MRHAIATPTSAGSERQANAMATYDIGVIPGDGIGPEVTAEALKVLKAVSDIESFDYKQVDYPWSGEYYLKT